MSETKNIVISWVDAFPWIERAVSQQKRRVELPSPADVSRQWLRAIDPSAETFDVMVGRVVELAQDAMPMTSLGEIFPFVPHNYAMNNEAIRGFDANDATHTPAQAFEDVAPIYLIDSIELEHYAVFDEKAFFVSLGKINADSALNQTDELLDIVADLPTVEVAEKPAPALSDLPAPTDMVYELVEDFLTQFNERDLRILMGRKLEQPAKTLDALGAEFGITRERVRQLESLINRQMTAWFDNNDEVALHSMLIRKHVGKICTLESLLAKFPALTENINDLDLPSWYVFDQFDDSFESDGTWVTVPSLKEVAADFDDVFEAHVTEEGFIELDRLSELLEGWGSASITGITAWAQSRGYRVVGNLLVSPEIRSMNSLAVVALANLGVPASETDLHALVAADKSIRSFSNQLASDSRLIRAANAMWALASWGGTEYLGIRQEILRRVDENETVTLAELVAELPALYNVAASSVHTYATTWPLESVGGVVRRASKPVAPTRPLYRGKGVIFIDGGLAFRMVVNADNLRGSGFALPSPLAGALGVVQGGEREFMATGSEKPVRIRWKKMQPQASSIQPNLKQLGAKLGDVVALTFVDGRSNVVSFGPLTDEPGEAIRQLLLLTPTTPLTTAAIATALGLASTSTWAEILELVQLRHETELLAAIQSFMSL